jgi:hypothetical protein
MSLEHGPVVNIEQRRLTPVIDEALSAFLSRRPYLIDPGFSEGFGADDPRIVGLQHSFTSPTTLQCSLSATYEDGSTARISALLGSKIADYLTRYLDEIDSRYTVEKNDTDTTLHSYLTFIRTT